MNKDHQADLTTMLRHHLGPVTHPGPNPQMTDVTLSSMTITTSDGTTHTIPIVPPMKSFSDVRPSLVAMTLTARAALGLDADGNPVRVDRFLPPSGVAAVVVAAVTFYFVSFPAVRLGLVQPGRPAYQLLERFGAAEAFTWLVEMIFWPVLGVHVVECWWLERSRLRGRVRRGSRVWWMWLGCCFLEGFTCFQRFDGEVARLAGAHEGKKKE
jgi:hypothetical protein